MEAETHVPESVWRSPGRDCCPAVALAAVLLHLVLLSVYVVRHQADPSALVCAGSGNVGRPPFEVVTLGFGEPGYDGQSYYAVARNPWRLHRGEHIDPPAAWHQRIAYPLLCWLASGGDRHALLWAMPAVNLLAVGALAWLGARIALRHGRSSWWGFVLPLAVNAALPALRNLTDVVSTLAVLGLLSTWLTRGRSRVLFAWAMAALFTREQNLAVVGLVLVAALGSRRFGAAVLLALVLALWLGWIAVLAHVYGQWPFIPSDGNLGRPFAGMLDGLCYWGTWPAHRKAWLLLNTSLWHALLLVGLAVGAACRCRSRALALFLLGGVALAVLGGPSFYRDLFSYRRVLVWHSLGLWLEGVRGGGRGTLGVLSVSALWSCAAAA